MSNATYLAIIQDVYALTARPDLAAETALAIRKATMKSHMAETWKNDISNVIITLPVLDNTVEVSWRYSLDLTSSVNFPLYRKLSSIDEYNNPLTGYEIHFKELDNDRILDEYFLEDINYYYQAGQQVNLRANKWLVQLSVDYYKYPDITPATYTSWISDQFRDMIVCEAAASVFRTIGKDSEATSYGNMFAENLLMLQMSEI